MAGNVGKRGDSWSHVGVMERSGSTSSRKPSWVSRDCSRESETRRSGVEWVILKWMLNGQQVHPSLGCR